MLFFVAVVVTDAVFYLHVLNSRRLLLPFIVSPAVVCAVFYSNTVFNSNISAWNTGAVTTMQASKSSID